MNLLSLIPGFSWLRLTAITLALVALAALAWKWRHSGIVAAVAAERAVWVEDLAQRTAAQLAQEQVNRQKEADLNAIVNKQRTDYAKDLARRNATAALTADSLRQFREAVTSQSGQASTDSTTTSGIDGARNAIILECASTIGEMDNDLARVKSKVTLLQSYVADVCH